MIFISFFLSGIIFAGFCIFAYILVKFIYRIFIPDIMGEATKIKKSAIAKNTLGNKVSIRIASIDDARAISMLLCNTIQHINNKDYTKKEIREWLAYFRTQNIQEKFISKEWIFFVAILDKKIVGTVAIKQKTGKMRYLYVKKEFIGKGIGYKLLKHVENHARKLGLKKIILYSTVTAYDFYRGNGYIMIRKEPQIAGDVELKSIKMYKDLS